MTFGQIRRAFKPLFGPDRRQTVGQLLYIILLGVIIIDVLILVFHYLVSKVGFDITAQVLVALLIVHVILWLILRRGYVYPAAVLLAFCTWLAVTYQAWKSYGIHDVAIFAYVLIILTAALLTTWEVSLSLAGLSVLAIWFFAFSETQYPHPGHVDTPFAIARDLTLMFAVLILLIYIVFNTLRQALEKMQEEITERTRTEQALRREEERFRKIFQLTPAAVMITTLRDGRLVDANDAYWKLSGLEPAVSVGRTLVDLHLWDNSAERQDFVEELALKRSMQNLNHEFIDIHHKKHATSVFYEVIDLGDEPAVLTMHYDLTEQRKAQEALRRSDERFRKVFHSSPVAIVISTVDEGRIMDANAAYWQLSGHDPQTSMGRSTLELRPNYKAEQRNVFVHELLEKKSLHVPLYDFVNERGEHLKTVAFYELIEVGGQQAILSMFLDMTAQSQARDALRHSEARFRAMLEAVPDMVFEVKRDGTIIHFSPSAMNELGFQLAGTVGKTISQILPATADQIAFAVERALDSGQVHAFEFLIKVHDEQKTFEARVSPAGPDLVLVMMRDVSLNKWSQSEREKLIAELEEKNAELERFTYTVSHDLKAPLITIRGFLGFVREDLNLGNTVRLEKDMARINDATEKMQHLLTDLLELSRIGRLKHDPVLISTNGLLAEVVELLQGRIQEHRVQVKITGALPAIYGDRQRIFEVFQNLIDNAAKFMGDQVQPIIEVGTQGEKNGKPIFYVRDNGMGIHPQFKERIFGLFDKLNPQSEGTGVGLALVKRIIEIHGGRIWVESVPGIGTTFFFSLPSQPVAAD